MFRSEFQPEGEVPMTVMPMDLRQQTFRTAFRGYEPDQVAAFLNEAADAYEQTRRELDQARQELAELRAELKEHHERETTLRNTMVSAQKMADQVLDTAQQEARVIVREAESRADLVIEKAKSRLEELEREIDQLRLRRRDVETSLESAISNLQHALDFVREQNRVERDEKILLHRPRQGDAEAAADTGERKQAQK
jgi:cell division initiation protein